MGRFFLSGHLSGDPLPSTPPEVLLRAAASKGLPSSVLYYLKENPTIDVNQGDDMNFTALCGACTAGHDRVVAILLAHPAIDVNTAKSGSFPFLCAVASGRMACFRLLLKDSRVKVNEPFETGGTVLSCAASTGQLEIIKVWIASGREMDVGHPADPDSDAIAAARKEGKTEVATLLERFQENPEETRHWMRIETGWYNERAAEIFALVVFVADGLLLCAANTAPRRFIARLFRSERSPAARFFAIATQLPLELQMVLCYRALGSGRDNVPGDASELAFRVLAKKI